MADLPDRDRFGFWRDMMWSMLAPVEVRSEQVRDFQATIHAWALGPIQVSRVQSVPFSVHRPPRLIRQADPELYQLSLNLRGQAGLRQERQDVLVGQREFVFFDTSLPFDGWSTADHGLVDGVAVAFPRTMLPLTGGRGKRLSAMRLQDSAVGALLRTFLVGLAQSIVALTPADRVRLSTILLDLLAATVAHELGEERSVPENTGARVMRLQVYAFVEEHLGDPALAPAMVAAAHHISVRYLHRLFQDEGRTVSAWIRERRLRRCQRDLGDPQLAQVPVNVVAARWGFTDPAHFSRAFRAACGMPPGEYRRMMRHDGGGRASSNSVG
jgi:AraC-like DNA-binding protein